MICQFLRKWNINQPYNPVSLFLHIYPRETKSCGHKEMYIHVHISFIHNNAQLELKQISVIDKQMVLYLYNRILFNNKKE